uniref:Uncharacterized protein n=1 Tax=Anopheles atroparvus TaxID=41427 RepID=A0A182J725_ANOAO
MTVAGLNRFFKQHECVDIPYRQFGYPQLEVMLRSLSDIIQLNGQGPSALVLPAMTNTKPQHTGGTVGKRNTGNTRNANSVNRQNHSLSSYEGNSVEPPARHGNDGLRSCSTSGYSIEELKKMIQAMVISHAGTAMTVAQLNRDFKRYEGEEIPYRRFGFQQLDGMLRAMPDIVQLNGQGFSAFVSPVITRNSQHIREMIEKQKINVRKSISRPTYLAQNNRFDNSSNWHSNNTVWTRPDNNLGRSTMRNNSTPTDSEIFVMELIANYAKQFWY